MILCIDAIYWMKKCVRYYQTPVNMSRWCVGSIAQRIKNIWCKERNWKYCLDNIQNLLNIIDGILSYRSFFRLSRFYSAKRVQINRFVRCILTVWRNRKYLGIDCICNPNRAIAILRQTIESCRKWNRFRINTRGYGFNFSLSLLYFHSRNRALHQGSQL